MTCIDRALSTAAARREGYRAAARNTASDNPILAHAGGARSPLEFGNRLQEHSEQYNHFRGWVYTAIVRIATRLASTPVGMGRKQGTSAYAKRGPGRGIKSWQARKLPAYARKDATDLEVVENHWLLDALEDPNEAMTSWALFYDMACSLELTGKAFWWVFPGVDTHRIYPMPSDWMTPVHTAEMLYDHWRCSPSGALGESFDLPGNEVIYFPLPDPSNPLATISPLQTQAPAVATDEQIQGAQFRMFENGVFPGVVLTVGRLPGMLPGQPGHRPVLTPEQRKDLMESVRAMYEGAVNFNVPMIIDGMVEGIDRFTNTPLEMDFINSGKQTKGRIFQAFGVNEIIAGEIVGANRAQAAVAEALFLGQVVNPLGILIGQSLTKYLRRIGETDHVAWLEEQRPNDSEQRLKEWTVAATKGYVTPDEFRSEVLGIPPREEEQTAKPEEHWTINERRAADGLPPIPGGDAIFLPAAQIPALEFPSEEDSEE